MKKIIACALALILAFTMPISTSAATDGQRLFSYAAEDIAEIVATSDYGGTMTNTLTAEKDPIKIGKIIRKLNAFTYSHMVTPSAVSDGYISLKIIMDSGEIDVINIDTDGAYPPNSRRESKYISVAPYYFGWGWFESNNSPFFSEYADKYMWARHHIDWVYQRDIMDGISETLFAPGEPMDRASAAAAVYRLDKWAYMANENNPPVLPGEAAFEDMPSDPDTAEAIIWAAANGIIKGVGNNLFNPSGAITREEFATMLYRYTVLYRAYYTSGEYQYDLDAIYRFSDAGSVSPYAFEAVQWATGRWVIQGAGERINPQGLVTRAEAAAMLQRSPW